jgi:crotonobetainyl-CoA:carnitine CoA-transferase CaiB-like acyl-CoA transferase
MSDIVIENFRPGTMESWNLGYDQLRDINPRLIMLRTSGYGQTGPYSKRAGYASAGEAMGGLRYVGGFPDRPPPRMGISIGDTLAGIFATVGALAAVHERHRSGRGQMVDTAIYESVLACMESLIPEYAIGGRIRERSGTALKGIAPSNVYPTKDGEMIIAANQDSLFVRLCDAMGRPELAKDERFSSHTARGKNQEVLDSLISQWTRTLTTANLQAVLDRHAVAFGPINRAPDMLEDPHFIARESILRVAHKLYGEFPMQNVFPRLTRTPGRIKWVGPDLGEHNQEVLAELLGMSADQILRAQGH